MPEGGARRKQCVNKELLALLDEMWWQPVLLFPTALYKNEKDLRATLVARGEQT